MSSTFLDDAATHRQLQSAAAAVAMPPFTSSALNRFGGPNAVIVADVYTDPLLERNILYLVDTVAIPTRYHLQALATDVPLLDELTGVARRCIAPGSLLVLGPRLQHAVCDHQAVRARLLDTGLVRSLVAFDVLKRLDAHAAVMFDVTDNFDEMSKRPIGICSVACRLIGYLAGRQLLSEDEDDVDVEQEIDGWWLEQGLQRLLDVANALSDQRALDVTMGERMRWWLLGVYSAL